MRICLLHSFSLFLHCDCNVSVVGMKKKTGKGSDFLSNVIWNGFALPSAKKKTELVQLFSSVGCFVLFLSLQSVQRSWTLSSFWMDPTVSTPGPVSLTFCCASLGRLRSDQISHRFDALIGGKRTTKKGCMTMLWNKTTDNCLGYVSLGREKYFLGSSTSNFISSDIIFLPVWNPARVVSCAIAVKYPS